MYALIDDQIVDVQVVSPTEIVERANADRSSDRIAHLGIEKAIAAVFRFLKPIKELDDSQTPAKLPYNRIEGFRFFERMTFQDLGLMN